MKTFKDNESLIKQVLAKYKKIAMVGVSSFKKEEDKNNIKRKPSIIVMKYLLEFGYDVIPVNPNAVGGKLFEKNIVAKLEDIKGSVDIVNIFRPSKETPFITRQASKIGAKVVWLQYGIDNAEAKQIAVSSNIKYIANRCIKQEYQKYFLKINPVFPVLKR